MTMLDLVHYKSLHENLTHLKVTWALKRLDCYEIGRASLHGLLV